MNNIRVAVLIGCCLLIAPPFAHPALGEEPPADGTAEHSPRSSLDIYCGLHTMYFALQISGREMPFTDLLKPEYLSSQKGSSLADLEKAAKDFGLDALPVTSLTADNLCASQYPMILHVKKTPYSPQFDHFQLFLGIKDGAALIYDPPEEVRREPLHELMGRWNGNALVLSSTAIDADSLFWPSRKKNLLMIFGALGALLLVKYFSRVILRPELLQGAGQRLALSVAQACGLLLVGAMCGIIVHLGSEQGLLAHAETQEAAEAANFDSMFVVIDKPVLKKLLGEGAVVVDARYRKDFEHGHIPGAINIEPGASAETCKQALASVAPNTPIVVYCQSAMCPFAGKVARLLAANGHKQLMHYKEGWLAWKEEQ